MFISCTIETLPKEEDVPIALTMDDQVFDEHVEEESLHKGHEPIEKCMGEENNQPI
jgi:hypothetical protein